MLEESVHSAVVNRIVAAQNTVCMYPMQLLCCNTYSVTAVAIGYVGDGY